MSENEKYHPEGEENLENQTEQNVDDLKLQRAIEEAASYGLGPEYANIFLEDEKEEKTVELLEESKVRELITGLENTFRKFEMNFSLDELFAVTEMTVEQALGDPKRTEAKKYLVVMVDLLNNLKELTDIPKQKYKELEERYRHYSRAVGILNNGKMVHNRLL